jgi:hypothetical protein
LAAGAPPGNQNGPPEPGWSPLVFHLLPDGPVLAPQLAYRDTVKAVATLGFALILLGFCLLVLER